MGAPHITPKERESIKKRIIEFMQEADQPGMTMRKVLQKCKVKYGTFYTMKKEDKEFAEKVDLLLKTIWENNIDFTEGKLFERINGVTVEGSTGVYSLPPDVTAMALLLNGRAKDRGYGKSNIGFGDDGSNSINVKMVPELAATK